MDDPELVRRWWAADMGEVTHAEIDLRVGGTWRYVMVTNEGFEVAFRGEYQETVPNERIVSTEAYEGVRRTSRSRRRARNHRRCYARRSRQRRHHASDTHWRSSTSAPIEVP